MPSGFQTLNRASGSAPAYRFVGGQGFKLLAGKGLARSLAGKGLARSLAGKGLSSDSAREE